VDTFVRASPHPGQRRPLCAGGSVVSRGASGLGTDAIAAPQRDLAAVTLASARRLLLALVAIVLTAVAVAPAARAPLVVPTDVRVASSAKPHLTLRPKLVVAGGRLTFIGSGFRANQRVWLGVGPPQSEARFWGCGRTNRAGAFRKTLTVNAHVEPRRWVALACQRGCRIKAGAAFRVTRGRG
jgi:hypothetical protein